MDKLYGYISITTPEKEKGIVTPVYQNVNNDLFVLEEKAEQNIVRRIVGSKMLSFVIRINSKIKNAEFLLEELRSKPYLFVSKDLVLFDLNKREFIDQIFEKFDMCLLWLNKIERKNLFMFLGLSNLAQNEYKYLEQDFLFDHKFLFEELKDASTNSIESVVNLFEILFSENFKKIISNTYTLKDLFILSNEISMFNYRINENLFREKILPSAQILDLIKERTDVELFIILCKHLSLDFAFLDIIIDKIEEFNKVPVLQEYKEIILEQNGFLLSDNEKAIVTLLAGPRSIYKQSAMPPVVLCSIEEREMEYSNSFRSSTSAKAIEELDDQFNKILDNLLEPV